MMHTFFKSAAILAAATLFVSACGSHSAPSVAIVVDRESYAAAGEAVDGFAASLSNEGKRGIVITENISHPDSIKMQLMKLYKEENLEGAIFIGNIPIPMVRDAQHFTTAFKMSQKRDWKESSVPSDRFYDDFDLKFDYIRQDEDIPAYHYYSLSPDSPQYIECDIYSARIKVPVGVAEDEAARYEALAKYLNKAAAAKSEARKMRHIFHFAGHGYNSESYNARIDEAWALRHQFPFLGAERGCDLDFINYDFEPFVREKLLSALAAEDLDLAILHHHGSEETQYLNGTPPATMLSTMAEATRKCARDRMRRSRDPQKTKMDMMKSEGIPASWIDNYNNPELVAKDSAASANLDLNIPDIKGRSTNAKIVVIDACYNGAFNCDDYIAGYYLFNEGSTIVVKANSVNTLQDTWTNELMGLLGEGVCVGNWAKGQMTLESHLIGDPTFRFEAREGGDNLDLAINAKRGNAGYWRRLLRKGSTDERSLAIKRLSAANAISSEEILKIERDDEDPVVRMAAFMALRRRADGSLVEACKLAIGDSYELIQRMGMLVASENGSPEFAEIVNGIKTDPLASPRVRFYSTSHSDVWSENSALMEEYAALADADATAKEKLFTIQRLRNSRDTRAIESVVEFLRTSEDAQLKIAAAEALGWYVTSFRRDEIVESLNGIVAEEKDEEVAAEIRKSINRLTNYRPR